MTSSELPKLPPPWDLTEDWDEGHTYHRDLKDYSGDYCLLVRREPPGTADLTVCWTTSLHPIGCDELELRLADEQPLDVVLALVEAIDPHMSANIDAVNAQIEASRNRVWDRIRDAAKEMIDG